MPESEDPKKVSSNDLRNSQFGGGIIDAGVVNANQIGNTVKKTINNLNVTLQIQTMLMPIVEKSQNLPESQISNLITYINQLINDATSLEISQNTNNVFTKAHEYKIENISECKTIYAHYLITKHLEPIKVRCSIALATASATLEAIDISDFYDDEYIYEATKTFCDVLFICLDWRDESIKWFYAFSLPDDSKKDLSTCPHKLLEHAFGIIRNEAKNWVDNSEVAIEVNVYLNLLIQQLDLS